MPIGNSYTHIPRRTEYCTRRRMHMVTFSASCLYHSLVIPDIFSETNYRQAYRARNVPSITNCEGLLYILYLGIVGNAQNSFSRYYRLYDSSSNMTVFVCRVVKSLGRRSYVHRLLVILHPRVYYYALHCVSRFWWNQRHRYI